MPRAGIELGKKGRLIGLEAEDDWGEEMYWIEVSWCALLMASRMILPRAPRNTADFAASCQRGR